MTKKPIGYAKVRWWNLRENKCPKCSKDFFKSAKVEISKDSVHCPCGFFITMEKFQSIVNDLNTKDVQQKLDEMENQRLGWQT